MRRRFRTPFGRSYWVVPGKFLAGCYPGSQFPQEHRKKLTGLLDAGIRTFVNLMEEDELDRWGRPFEPYEDFLRWEAAQRGIEIEIVRVPIRDGDIPSDETMTNILEIIDRFIADGRPVFVHCWGGRGRTGTVVGCWLARHGIAVADAAVARIQELRKYEETADLSSPQTCDQLDMVKRWKPLEDER